MRTMSYLIITTDPDSAPEGAFPIAAGEGLRLSMGLLQCGDALPERAYLTEPDLRAAEGDALAALGLAPVEQTTTRSVQTGTRTETVNGTPREVPVYEDREVTELVTPGIPVLLGAEVPPLATLKADLTAELRARAEAHVLAKWPVYKQLNVALGIYDDTRRAACVAAIQAVREAVAGAEAALTAAETHTAAYRVARTLPPL